MAHNAPCAEIEQAGGILRAREYLFYYPLTILNLPNGATQFCGCSVILPMQVQEALYRAFRSGLGQGLGYSRSLLQCSHPLLGTNTLSPSWFLPPPHSSPLNFPASAIKADGFSISRMLQVFLLALPTPKALQTCFKVHLHWWW